MPESDKNQLEKIKIISYLVGPLTEEDINSASKRAKKILAAVKAFEQISREIQTK